MQKYAAYDLPQPGKIVHMNWGTSPRKSDANDQSHLTLLSETRKKIGWKLSDDRGLSYLNTQEAYLRPEAPLL